MRCLPASLLPSSARKMRQSLYGSIFCGQAIENVGVRCMYARTIFFTRQAKIPFFKDLGDGGMPCPAQNIESLRLTGKVLSNNDLRRAMNLGPPPRLRAMMEHWFRGRQGWMSQGGLVDYCS